MKIEIRYAKLEDAARLVEIYCYYVEKTAITFEYEVPAVEEFQQRMVHVMEKYPYLVAKVDDQIVGYAYAGTFKAHNITNLNACISSPIQNDEYLDTNSIDYHHHLGYQMVGEFHQCGYKFKRWYNMVWMEKMIGEHKSLQPEVKLFPEIQDKIGFERFSW